MNNAESDTGVKQRLEVMHGDIVTRMRDGKIPDSEIGKLVAYEQAISFCAPPRPVTCGRLVAEGDLKDYRPKFK